MPKTLRGSFEQALRPLPYVVKGVQACRLPALKPPKMPTTLRGSFDHDQALMQATALCCYGREACRLPAFRPLPSDGKGVQHAVCQPSNQAFLLDNTILQRKFAGTAREPTLQPMLSNVQQRSLSLLIFCVPFCPERANVSSGIAFPPACHA